MPQQPKRAMPPVEDLVEIIRAAAANADTLADDAAFLARAGRFPRAHSLAVLAVEEVGKAMLCVVATFPTAEMEQGFWTEYRKHTSKLAYAHVASTALFGGDGPAVEQIATAAALVDSDAATKLSGLCVDYSDDGRVLTPADLVTEEDALTAIRAARTLVDEFGTRWTGPDVLDRLLAARAAGVATHLDAAREAFAQDPDATLATIRAFYRHPLGQEESPVPDRA